MNKKKNCIAMLLAGGQGSRLGVLTRNIAKPAVPFGGKYRIIDFPLSNCINSGIDTVGVLTQYQPYVLHDYIGTGQSWDLDRIHGGVSLLPPYERGPNREWYKGTANAIYQNISFIDMKKPDYVAILSGDHIYKMNYAKMLAYHIQNNAACTIAVIEVPTEEASRFGIMNTNPDGSIYQFEEKPAQPKSNKASMGVYIFTWGKLRHYLERDERDPASSNDFGKNVIPAMLGAGERMFAFDFQGYWKDVGTIESLWEANMDLLKPNLLTLHDKTWRIYARTAAAPPHFAAAESSIQNALITEGSVLYGNVHDSVIYTECFVGLRAEVAQSVIMPRASIGQNAKVYHAIVAEDAIIEQDAIVGAVACADEEQKITVIGPGVRIGAGVRVQAGAMVENDLKAQGG